MNWNQHYFTPPKSLYTKDIQASTAASKKQYNHENLSAMRIMTPQQLSNSFRNQSVALLKRPESSKDQNCVIEDRFIPSRKYIQNFDIQQNNNSDLDAIQMDPQLISAAQIYSHEVLHKDPQNIQVKSSCQNQIDTFKNKNLFRYKLTTGSQKNNLGMYNVPINELSNTYSKSRRINKNPCKVLDAPALTDDFYLNLIDWSQSNQLAVGLGSCIYLWNAVTAKVTRLCELHNDMISSVCWSKNSSLLSIGCTKGDVQVWDVNEQKRIRKMQGHEIRVGSMAWSKKFLSTGSRDKTILQRDIRAPVNYVQKLSEHSQEICGLKWSSDQQYLASGGNDNKVIVWNEHGQAINKFGDHKAAAKAIAWSPHQHGLLATGGGTADRMIKMRNIFSGEIICQQDTGSQVCNLEFSKSLHQIVSTHGYSQNEINIWQYPKMKKVATLKGHSHRVLYLATSPDGSQIVTGAGDQTLRFWNVFPSVHQKAYENQSVLEMGISFR